VGEEKSETGTHCRLRSRNANTQYKAIIQFNTRIIQYKSIIQGENNTSKQGGEENGNN